MVMDLLGSLRVFTAIAREGSFSLGASINGVPQSTASRHIARLEEHLGRRLFIRTTRVVTLTDFGRTALAAALELLAAADSFEERVDAARTHTTRLFLPDGIPDLEIATLTVKSGARGVPLSVTIASSSGRRDAVRTRNGDAAVLSCAPEEADWSARLGLAAANTDAESSLSLGRLRPHRGDPVESWQRITVLPEDIGTPAHTALVAHAAESGLAASQVHAASTVSAALSVGLSGDGFVCCSRTEATRWGLDWQSLSDLTFERHVRLYARDEDVRSRVLATLLDDLRRLFGEQEDGPREQG